MHIQYMTKLLEGYPPVGPFCCQFRALFHRGYNRLWERQSSQPAFYILHEKEWHNAKVIMKPE